MNIEQIWNPDSCQQEVINATGGYHLVLAPPGCGKTQILTERIRQAHKQGVAYEQMLCLTFTNRAARGMRERIAANIEEEEVEKVYVGNVHRFCSKLLFDNLIIPAESSVIDDDDAVSIIARYCDEDEISVKANYRKRQEYLAVIQFAGLMYQIIHHHPKELRLHPNSITQTDVVAMRKVCQVQQLQFTSDMMIDMYLHDDVYEDMLKNDAYDIGSQVDIGTLLRKMKQAYYYQKYKKDNKLLDFEDLLLLTYDALVDDKEKNILRYSWIQVDEVQDLNPMQLAIIDLLTSKDFNTVMYLGDEQQAIFSFMGAKMSTIELLQQRCKDQLHRLFVNHRSPKYLLDVFNTYAEKQLDIDKNILPTTDFEPKRTGNELVLFSSEQTETEYKDVANVVKRLCNEYETDTTAVIVSANADAELMSKELTNIGQAHFKVSGEDLFVSPCIKLLLAHLNILSNEHNFIGWARLLKGLRVFETNAAARSFVSGLLERAMLPSDFLLYQKSTYVQMFVQCYEQQDIVVFDTETTGLNVFEDDILQIAAVKIRQGQIVPDSAFVVFMETNREIPKMLGDIVNPIIEERRHHELLSHAEGLKKFMKYVGDSILLGHNADYDYHILDFNLQRYLPEVHLHEQSSRYFDSLKLIRLLEPNLKEYKLKYLLSVLNLEGENSHLADADVNATCSVVRYCYGKAKLLIPSQLEWMQHPRFQKKVEVFRNNYLPIYKAAKKILYVRTQVDAKPALITEIKRFYQYLLDEKMIEPQLRLHYIIRFLLGDMIHNHATPSLIEQLHSHITELNTLKEADLCNSKTLDERVFVTTVHKAKGLEFDNVIIFDAIDTRYPNYYNKDIPQLVAEDKRKFYVAMTRAKKRLYVVWSRNKCDYHNILQPRKLTPFMKQIEKSFTSV